MKRIQNLSLLTVLVWLLPPAAVFAQDGDTLTHEVGHWFSLASPLQIVRSGDVDLLFEADVTICRDRTNRGFGFVTIGTRDALIELQPVWGGMDQKTHGVILAFTPIIDGPIGPDDLVVLVVQPSVAGGNDRLMVDLSWGLALPLDPLPPFEVVGTISESSRGDRCEPADFGQFRGSALLSVPLQAVEMPEAGAITALEANLLVYPDNAAAGYVNVHTRLGPVPYDAVFGAGMPDGRGGVVIVVFLLHAERERTLSIDDHLLKVIVTQEAAGGDALLWSLTPGTSTSASEVRTEQLNNKYPENMNHRG